MANKIWSVLTVVTIYIYILESNAASFIKEKNKVCLTPECSKHAKAMLKKIDNTVDVCDDFYSFACGQFIKTTKIPDDKVSVNTFTLTDDILLEQLKTIVASPVEELDIEPFKKVKKLYSACMNEELLEQRGLNVSLNIFERFGGWPVVKGDDWKELPWTWQKSVFDCRKNGYSNDYILSINVAADFKNSTRRIVYIDQPYFWLSNAILLKGREDPVVKAYQSFQIDLAVIYGADKKRAVKEMTDALDFEIALTKISAPSEKRRNASELYNPITIKELQRKYPFNNWLQYFNDLFPAVSRVRNDEVVVVFDVAFFNQLGDLLKSTPKRTIANYIMWRVASASTDYLTQRLRKRQLDYYAVLNGQQTEKPRWQDCLGFITDYFGIATSALYVRKYFNQDSKAVALDMVNSIREEFEDILSKVAWMDQKTRKEAETKAKAIYSHIGYPDELMDDRKLIDYYKKVEVDENKFIESILSAKIFHQDMTFEKLRETLNKTDWKSHANVVEVNAAYSVIENSIRFTAGILQGQFFSADRPRYMNYAAIGMAIGHEITHGFDDEGRQFDLNGNLVDWWGKETTELFKQKAKCFIDQYSNYTDSQTGLKLNGINTQGENIADNGGVKEAYLAYQRSVKLQGSEETLPGLNFSPNQLFFITFAQTWCAVDRPEILKKTILTDVHSPNQFRILGSLKNMKEFSYEFKCPKGSKMNPIKKCEVW